MAGSALRASTEHFRDRLRPLVDPAAGGSTRDSLWWVIALLLAGLRLGTLAQMAPSFTLAVRTSPNPPVALLTWILAAVSSLVLCVVVWRTRRPPGNRMMLVDAAFALALFGLGSVAVAETDRVGTWIGFQASWALSVLMGSAGAPSWRLWGAVMVTLISVDLWFVLPDTSNGDLQTIAGNLLTLILLPTLIRAAFRYATRIAEIADESRARAAELARREEERRAQAAMHNGAALMSLMARDDLSEAVKEALREQALEETQRMRRYLNGERVGEGRPEVLAELVERAAAGFPDLRIDTLTDLGAHVRLTRAAGEAMAAALTSVLLNVRVHAGANRVVMHLDEEDGTWTLSVHDDGEGFDVDATDEGVGLGEVVRAQLALHDVAVSVESMVGAGTTVLMSGAWRGEPAEVLAPAPGRTGRGEAR
ncbi:MAG: hypothetical protein ACI379_16070 [Nocardioides sp.]|uniref:hypothetical protein n=1 Tax=Nocardioides sp. TaxID=35761 RepID=UPI003F0A5335